MKAPGLAWCPPLFCGLVFVAAVAAGQGVQPTTGVIEGRVEDRSGEPLSDAVVTISGGSSVRIAFIVCTAVSPMNGRWPDSNSYKTTPKLKMSERWSTGIARTCSGDM